MCAIVKGIIMTHVQTEYLNFCRSYSLNVFGVTPVAINTFFADVQAELHEFICLAEVYLKLHRLQDTGKSHLESFTEVFTSPHNDHFDLNDSASVDILDYAVMDKDEIEAAKLLNSILGLNDFFTQENLLDLLFYDMQKIWSIDAGKLKEVVNSIQKYDQGVLKYFVSCLEGNKAPDIKNILTTVNCKNPTT